MEREILKEKIKKIEKVISLLENKKRCFQQEIKKIEISEWKEKKANGWKPFIYYSSYYGSECGVGDVKLFYVFPPYVNIEKWRGIYFSHGDSTENETNKEWEKFTDSIEDCDYVDDHIIQSVWPELYEEYQRL